jgi:CHRD domain-containing protein
MRTSLWIITLLLAAGPASAHLFEGTVTMTATEEVPAPAGTSATTGGVATFEVEDDLTLQYEITYTDLTGEPKMAHIHEGAPGVAGDIVIPLVVQPGGIIKNGTAPLTAEQLAKLQSGDYYVNVHTAQNFLGEIRGQIRLTAVKGTCSCKTLSQKDFRACVKAEIKKLSKDDKKSQEVKNLKRAVKKSLCGTNPAPKKKQASCCLPANDVGTIVTGELCAPVKKDSQCAALGGQFIADKSCQPNPCSPPASPSGAFVQ